MAMDSVFQQIGEFGSIQKLYLIIMALFHFYAKFELVQTVFTSESPEFQCITPNGTIFRNRCSQNLKVNCKVIHFEKFPDTFPREWSLICDEKHNAKLMQSIFMTGVLMGALTLGPVADALGRRMTLMISISGSTGLGLASSFMPNFFLYAIARFLVGIFTAGNMTCSFVLATELLGPTKRGLAGNVIHGAGALGIICFSGLAYFIRKWRIFTVACSSIGGIVLVLLWWVPESPRWLLTKGRQEKAVKILNHIAKKNGKILQVPSLLNVANQNQAMKDGGATLKDMFGSCAISLVIFIQLLSWFVNSCLYYGLTVAAGTLELNVYLSEALSGIVEIPGFCLANFLIGREWWGRRKTLAFLMVLGGLSCLIVKFSSVILFPLLGKMAVSATFSIIYVQGAELFPTVLRNSGIGLCSSFARIGGIAAPIISLTEEVIPAGQFLIMGTLSCISGIVDLGLPETLARPMPETMEDMLQFPHMVPVCFKKKTDIETTNEKSETGCA